MKNLNFLSKSGSQSYGHRVTTLALTVGSPSAHRRGIMLRLLSVLVLVLTFGVGNAWGAVPTGWSQVTSLSGMSAGDKIIIVTNDGTKYLNGSISSGNKKHFSASDLTTSSPSNASASGVILLESTGTANKYKLKLVSTSKYITATSTSSGSASVSATSDSYGWTFTFSDETFDAQYQESGKNAYCRSYNNSDFRTYSGKNGDGLKIYKYSSTPSYTINAQSNNTSWGTVSVSGTTITATPADCYQVASGTSGYNKISGTGTITHTGNSNTISVTPTSNCSIQVIFEKKIVNTYIDEIQDNGEFEDCSTSAPSLTDKSAATTGTCAQQHYHFVGWVTAANKANPTDANIIEAGETVAINGTTYYAVWAKGTGGGSFDGEHGGSFKIYANVSGTNHYATGTGSKISSTTTASDATEYTFTKVTENNKTYFTIKTGNNYITKGSSNTDFGTSTTAYNWIVIEGTHGSWRIVSSTVDTRGFIYRASTYNVFGTYTLNGINGTEYYDLEIGGSTSYSDYITNCCEPLGQINGSVSWDQTTAALEWADLDHVSSWAVQYKEHSAENWNTWNGEQATADSKRSVTITGLTCGTAYDFRTIATPAANYCELDSIWNNGGTGHSTSKWNISYNLTKTVALSEGPAQGANACGDFSATFSKNASYTFPANITVQVGDATLAAANYTWNNTNGTLFIDGQYITGNVSVTIAGVAPANPIVTPNPTALSFDQVKKGADVPAAQDIAITGQNLTAALVVESSNTSLYTVSLKSGSLTPDGNKDASPVITVTPQEGITSTAGDKNATITISGGGLDEAVVVNVTFNVQETYTVNWYVNGSLVHTQTDVANTDYDEVPSDFSAFDDCKDGLTFIGWKEGAIDGGSTTSAPSLANIGSAISAANKDYYAVFAEGTPGSAQWEKATSIADLTASDVFVIVGNNGSNYAMSNNNGTTNPPAAVAVTIVNDAITSEVADNLQWNISGDATNGYTFYPNGSTTTWLYCTNANNGVRVGTNDNKIFKPDNAGYLKNDGTSRYVGIYDSQDWRCYTAHTGNQNNIDNQKFAYYKYTEVPANWTKWYTTCPHVARVTLSAADVENGSISFAKNETAITSIVTEGESAVTVDVVVASHDTGYGLSDVEVSGVTGASYSDGVITIPANAEGTLTATATFAQADYSVTMEQSPAAGATLTGAQDDAHYGATINISTDVPAGYLFKNWTASPSVTFADASATSTSFTMPDGNVTVTANFIAVHDVAWAIANTPAEGTSDFVYVKGIISSMGSETEGIQITSNYNNATYYISDLDANGNPVNSYEVYRGKNVGNTDFATVNDLKVGDEVVVYGKLKTYSSVKEFDAGNYIIAKGRTAALLSSVVVSAPDASQVKTEYVTGETFLYAGLNARAVYNTGYQKDVTAAATFKANGSASLTVTANATVNVTATWSETTSADYPVTISVTTKVLQPELTLSESALTGYLGQALPKPTTITAHFIDNTVPSTENVTLLSVIDENNAYDASLTTDQTIPVKYTFGPNTATANYTVTLSSIVNTLGTAYSVAQAKEIIDIDRADGNDLDLELAANKVYVTGVVTSKSGSGPYTIQIKDNAADEAFLELYKCTFNGVTSVEVGDVVKAYGNLKWFANLSKYELDEGCGVVAVVRTPNLTVADVAEMEVNITADLAEADLTIDKDGSNGAITFSCSDPAVTIVNNKLHAAAEGNATVTATIEADGIYTEASTTFNVHVIAERTRYTVTFDAGEAGDNVSGDAPETIAAQLENAPVTIPATCSWTWANHKFTGWAVTYGENVSAEVTNNQFSMPGAAVTVTAQWAEVATAKISFVVGGVEKASIDKEQEVEFTIDQDGSAWAPTGFTFVGWATEEQAEETEVAPTTITKYTPQAGVPEVMLYGIYSRVEGAGETNHYVLDYTDDGVKDMTLGYGNAVNVTATDGSKWVVKAYKNNGMQINKSSNGSIKVPNCPGNIVSIAVTGNSSKAIGFSESDYSGSGTITYVVQGTDATLQNLSFAGKTVTIGYIVPVSNANQITHIDVAYDAAKTYYTSSPVEKVTITFNANGGNGGCTKAIINKGAEYTICETAPTKSHSEFAGWKLNETTTIYQANQNIGEVEEDITLTAQWEDAATYDVTYNVNGSSDAAPTQEAQYAGDQFEVGAAVTKEGFTFQGWKYGSKLYKAGAQFTMPAEAVEFVAQWRKASVPVDKMSMVISASALADGMQVALGYGSGENFAMAGDIASGKSFMSSITEGVSMSNGVATYTNDVIVMTLEQAESGWKITKDGTNYLTLNGADVKWDTQANATVWTITFENGNAKIATSTYWIQYNSGSPRFKTYGASSNMKDIQLYGKAVVVTDDASISDLGYVEGDVIVVNSGVELAMNAPSAPTSITVKDGATVTVSAQTTANNITVEKGGTLDIQTNGTVKTDETFVIYSTLGKGNGGTSSGNAPGSSSQIKNANKINATGDVFFELELTQETKASAGWYAFSVPFPVDAMTGVYYGNTQLQNEVGYAIMSYHGDKRAAGEYAWKKYRDIMVPGVLYIIAVGDTDYKTLRFKKHGNEAFSASTNVAVKQYSSVDNTYAGWNGIGNPSMQVSYLPETENVYYMQFLDHANNRFQIRQRSKINLVVGSAFFIQYRGAADGQIAINTGLQDDASGYLAPTRERSAVEESIYEISLFNTATNEVEDNVFITAREEATNSYEIGRDVAKMIMGTVKCAQMSIQAYGKQLGAADFPLVNGQAAYPLTITAPAAGTYTISTEAQDNADIYLTQDGAIIWNLSMGEYELNLTQGTMNDYGLLLIEKTPGIATGVDEISGEKAGVQKIVLEDKVFILRGGKMYDVTGKAVK